VAAETVSPDRYELMQTVDSQLNRITGQVHQQLERANQQLGQITRRLQLQHPRRALQQLKVRLNYAYEALLTQKRNRINNDKHRLQLCQSIITQSSPLLRIRRQREAVVVLNSNNVNAIKRRILDARHALALQVKSLDALSPLKTLARGFAKVSKNQKLVSSVNQLASGDEIEITLSDGSKQATVQ
jgi:exodeoxyribonuclease VII large subunit